MYRSAIGNWTSDSLNMPSRDVEIVNRLGLHARAASVFVKKAGEFACNIQVEHKGAQANGKRIMSMLMLEAALGDRITLTTEGEDGQEALDALVSLIEDRFGEDE